MNLATTIYIYAGGPGSGCQGPNCGRPSTGASHPPYSRWMMLELRAPNSKPTPFANDDRLAWHWNEDKSSLIVEVDEDRPEESTIGMGVTTQYKVPRKNIAYFGPEETSPAYLKKKNLPPQRGKEFGYVMPEEERVGV